MEPILTARAQRHFVELHKPGIDDGSARSQTALGIIVSCLFSAMCPTAINLLGPTVESSCLKLSVDTLACQSYVELDSL